MNDDNSELFNGAVLCLGIVMASFTVGVICGVIFG